LADAPHTNSKNIQVKTTKTYVPYSGDVWCLTTRSSNFCVKQGDFIFFTGNSAGCIVVNIATPELFSKAKDVRNQLLEIANTESYIPLYVIDRYA
jgi:hypothetical protein